MYNITTAENGVTTIRNSDGRVLIQGTCAMGGAEELFKMLRTLNKGKRFAVAYNNICDNDLSVVVVFASNWKVALCLHPKLSKQSIGELPDTLEETQEYFWNGDCNIDVKKIL